MDVSPITQNPLTILSTQYLHSLIQRKSVISLKTTSPFISAVHRYDVNITYLPIGSNIKVRRISVDTARMCEEKLKMLFNC